MNYKAEIDELTSARIRDLTQQDERHGLEVDEIQSECQKKINEINEKWQQVVYLLPLSK